MRKINFILCLALTATISLFYACHASEEEATPQAETPTYTLLSDDGTGVLFTSYSVGSNIPAQFKLYDNYLRAIMNGETIANSQGASNYHLDHVRFMLTIFGLDYQGTTISQITCEKSENPELQLHFGHYEINGTFVDDSAGIPWNDLIDVQNAPLIEKRVLPCTGDGRNFEVTLFEDLGISDDEFTLYFDFTGAKIFSGKLVITEAGKEPSTDGVILSF